VVDAAQWAASRLQAADYKFNKQDVARQWFVRSGCQHLIVVTAHRRENWGAPMQGVIQAVVQLLLADEHLAVVWPVHLNPVVKDAVTQAHAAADASVRARWHLTQPLNYPELIDLMRSSHLLLTDSGGIQEEAVALTKPVLILRNVTERPEVLDCGLGELVGTDTASIVSAVQRRMLKAEVQHIKPFNNPFGDGTAGLQIATYMADVLGGYQTEMAAA
jgi:UDP-N-acetylglucosamine 2-epimerase (non-hydrolysing)